MNGAITRFLRATYAPGAWCQTWDVTALRFWELELQHDFRPDQQLQFVLPLKFSVSAFLGAWELCLHDVAKTVGLSSAEAVRARFPDLAQNFTAAESAVRALGAAYTFDWEACFANPRPKGQKSIMTSVRKSLYAQLSQHLSADDGQGATFQSSGGKGARTWRTCSHHWRSRSHS